jgi:hypothetical protein
MEARGQFQIQAALHPGKAHDTHCIWVVGGPQSWTGRTGEKKNLLSLSRET